jgi:hypothetical protein
MAVPEATVYEYYCMASRENYVGRARQVPAMKAEAIPESVQQRSESDLGGSVFSLYCLHEQTATVGR